MTELDETESESAPGRSAYVAMAVGAIVVGAVLRLAPVGSALLAGDEFHTLRQLGSGYGHLFTHHSTTGAGMLLPIAQQILADVFGLGHWTIRAPAVMGGIGLVIAGYLYGRSLVGPRAAALATLGIATSSSLVFYSHFARAYAIQGLLSVLLVYTLDRVIKDRYRGLTLGWVALLVAMLPYVHLTAAPFVAAVWGVTLLVLAVEGRMAEAVRLGLAGGAGAILAGALYLPAWTGLVAFFTAKTNEGYGGAFGALDVAGVVFGHYAGGTFALLLFGIAAVHFAWLQGRRSLLLLVACLAPLVALVILRPFGGPYAYARYVLASLPFVFLVIGHGLADPLARLVRGDLRARASIIGATTAGVLALALAIAGPLPKAWSEGPHANTYLALYPLPAFDAPWPQGSAFYRDLGERNEALRIIEAPALVSRTRHLYRHYWRQHGRDTVLAAFPLELEAERLPSGPYVALSEADWRARARADYLVFHKDIEAEVASYWSSVFDDSRSTAASGSTSATRATMERNRRFGWFPDPATMRAAHARIERELGPASYRDSWIDVWDLREASTLR